MTTKSIFGFLAGGFCLAVLLIIALVEVGAAAQDWRVHNSTQPSVT